MQRHVVRRAVATIAMALLLLVGFSADPAFAITGGEDTVSIPVSVTTEGQGIPGETYTVKIEPVGDAPAPASDMVTLEGTELKAGTYTGEFKFSFADARVGEYSYRVYQVAPEDSTGRGSYDGAVYNVKITFEHPNGDMDKTDVVASIRKQGDSSDVKYDACAFTNAYANLQPGKSDPPVSKRIVGDSPAEKTTFTFVLEPLDGAPLPVNAQDGKVTATIDGEGTIEFGEIDFTEAGVYTYRCYEVNDGADGYTYDTTVYYARYAVTETTEGFDVVRTIVDQDGNEVKDLTFTNDYKAPTTPATAQTAKPMANPDTSDTNNVTAMQILAALGICFVGVAAFMRLGKRDEK